MRLAVITPDAHSCTDMRLRRGDAATLLVVRNAGFAAIRLEAQTTYQQLLQRPVDHPEDGGPVRVVSTTLEHGGRRSDKPRVGGTIEEAQIVGPCVTCLWTSALDASRSV